MDEIDRAGLIGKDIVVLANVDIEQVNKEGVKFYKIAQYIICPYASSQTNIIRLDFFSRSQMPKRGVSREINFLKNIYEDRHEFLSFYNFLGISDIFKRTGEYERGVECLERLSQSSRDSEVFKEVLVFSRKARQEKEFKSAYAGLKIAFKMCEDEENAFSELTGLSRKARHEGEYELSLQILKTAFGLDQSSEIISEDLTVLSGFLREEGFYQQCLDALKIAMQTGSYQDIVFEELDDLFIVWNVPKKTIKFYLELANEYPNNKKIYLRLGRYYRHIRDYQKAKDNFSKVLEIDPYSSEAQQGVEQAELFLLDN